MGQFFGCVVCESDTADEASRVKLPPKHHDSHKGLSGWQSENISVGPNAKTLTTTGLEDRAPYSWHAAILEPWSR